MNDPAMKWLQGLVTLQLPRGYGPREVLFLHPAINWCIGAESNCVLRSTKPLFGQVNFRCNPRDGVNLDLYLPSSGDAITASPYYVVFETAYGAPGG